MNQSGRWPRVSRSAVLALMAPVVVVGAVWTGCQRSPSTPGSGFVKGAGDTQLYYRILGAGSDTLLVVHGGPGAGMNALLPDLEPLHEGRTVIYFDQRGGGRSTLPTDTTGLTADLFVDDLEAVRRHFGIRRMDVLAHSFGAVLVARYAVAYPDRLARVVFLGATGPKRSDAGAYAQSLYAEADTAHLRRVFEPMSALLAGTAEDPVATCRAYHAARRAAFDTQTAETATPRGSECDMPPDALRYYFKYTAQHGPASFGDWDFTDSVYITSPLLVVFGDADSTALVMQRDWLSAAPNGRLFTVPGAGKAAHVQRPDTVFEAINQFLQNNLSDL